MAQTPQPATSIGQHAAAETGQNSGLPGWLVWVLSIGWLATLTGWWLNHRRKSPAEPEAPQEKTVEPPKDELPEILDELARAYQQADQAAARTAWLHWGQYRWPDNPPGNLNRLAKRCTQNVAQAVTLLDRTFYTPETVDNWRALDPRELLARVAPEKPTPVAEEGLIPLNP
jgi:hypothetical protein